jgi:hypothetical protein
MHDACAQATIFQLNIIHACIIKYFYKYTRQKETRAKCIYTYKQGKQTNKQTNKQNKQNKKQTHKHTKKKTKKTKKKQNKKTGITMTKDSAPALRADNSSSTCMTAAANMDGIKGGFTSKEPVVGK